MPKPIDMEAHFLHIRDNECNDVAHIDNKAFLAADNVSDISKNFSAVQSILFQLDLDPKDTANVLIGFQVMGHV